MLDRKFPEDSEDYRPIIVSRDLAHCLDLGPKDLADEKEFIKPVVDKSLELLKLVRVDRINGIKQKLKGLGKIQAKKATIHPDNRMYLLALTLQSASEQRPFLNMLPSRAE